MDEPTSALDPISTSKIEDLAVELKKKYTIIMVTHNMQQAGRRYKWKRVCMCILTGHTYGRGEENRVLYIPSSCICK